MGDAAVAALMKEVIGRLSSVAVKEFRLIWGFKKDVLALKNDFEEIQVVLQDAEEKRVQNKAVEFWLKKLKSASLEVENVLDDISTEGMLQSLYPKIGKKYSIKRKWMFRFRTAHKVKALRSKLNDIKSQRFVLKLSPSGAITSNLDDVGVEGEMPDRETSSFVHSSLIYGRDVEMEKVVEKICNKDIGRHEDDDTIRVFGIWGMGGLGKTTLAQLVYNHERVNQYFELKSWVYVSEKFQLKEIIKVIIKAIDKGECAHTELEMLQESLQNKLRGKKFLIVLDDVWIEEDEKVIWDKLSETLSCGAEESIIMMTTRSQTTSQMMAKVDELQHTLGCLPEDDSWLLFEKLAFTKGRERDDKSLLEPIGREIVTKCKGLPLAVKTLGSLMWSKRSRRDWERVKESKIWQLQEKNNILPTLRLSYNNLLPHLRRCFAYCCLFPKGRDFTKDEMVRLWLSNGFIPPRGETSLYLLGEDIFDCLVWRSFFQVVKLDKKEYNVPMVFDDTDRYVMHDLMHDLAHDVMKDDILVEESGMNVISGNEHEVLHLSSKSYPGSFLSPTSIGKLTSLRSIITEINDDEENIRPIDNHVYLRVLYLNKYRFVTISESIWKLKHLKYLNLSYSNIEALPESIVYLQNLQVLLLINCRDLWKLPEGLRYMSNLQCVDVSIHHQCGDTTSRYSLEHWPQGIKELTNLRILPTFHVGHNIGARIGELGDLNNLEGTLHIFGLENVGGLSEARSANLKSKRNLLVLKLRWLYSERFSHEEVLEGLEPNPCLKTLEIHYYMGKNFSPSWMASLSNLVEIRLIMCQECVNIEILGRLPNLRSITLDYMLSLERFHNDNIGNTHMFPCLQELHIVSCWKLVSLPSNLQKLKVLTLRWCERLASLPEGIQNDLDELMIEACPHLYERYEKDIGVDWPKISHITNVEINEYSR